jgi:hypothetical protein
VTRYFSMRRASAALIITALLVSSVGVGTASAATNTNAWQAKVGSSGVNGTAKISRFTTGTGSIAVKFAKLRASTTLPLVIYKGTCSKVGAVLFKLTSVRSSSSGAVSKTLTLTSSQVKLVLAATKGTAKIAVRVGSGTATKCGVFATLAVPAYVAAKVVVPGLPIDAAFLGTDVWVATFDNVVGISPTTNQVVNSWPFTLPSQESGVAALTAGAGSLWVLIYSFDPITFDYLPGSLLRIDPATGSVVATIPVSAGASHLAASANAVWVSSGSAGTVQRVDPATNAIVATVTMEFPGPMFVAADGIWVADLTGIARIDPATNVVNSTIPTQGDITGVAVTPTAIWVSHGALGQPNGALSKIDPVTKLATAILPLGAGPSDVVALGANVWVTMAGEPNVLRVNATTNAITKIVVPSVMQAAIVNTTSVWVVATSIFLQEDYPLPDSVVRINY